VEIASLFPKVSARLEQHSGQRSLTFDQPITTVELDIQLIFGAPTGWWESGQPDRRISRTGVIKSQWVEIASIANVVSNQTLLGILKDIR
jgi:hypothetical protein